MKKAQITFLAASAVTSLAAMLPMADAWAVVTCTDGTTTAAVTCAGSGGYTQSNVAFTGSVGVQIGVQDSATGIGICGGHVGGSQRYGMSSAGGSMETVISGADLVGSGAATATGGGCV